MTEQTVIDIAVRTLWVAMLVAAPALLSTMFAGVAVSIIQAATQINEQTLSFIPKIIVLTASLAFAGPWILETMVHFTVEIFHRIPTLTH